MTPEERCAKQAEYQRRYREKHGEEIRARGRERYALIASARKAKYAERMQNDPEYRARRREWNRRSRDKNCERFRELERARRAATRERQRELDRARRLKNPEPYRAAARRWAAKNTEYQRLWQARKKYGLSADALHRLFTEQDGRCAICGETETVRRHRGDRPLVLSIDHDHLAGAVRGLLCSACNTALGLFRDSEERLVAALDYLRRWRNERHRTSRVQGERTTGAAL